MTGPVILAQALPEARGSPEPCLQHPLRAVAIVRQAGALFPGGARVDLLAKLTDPAALSEPEEAWGRGLLDMARGP